MRAPFPSLVRFYVKSFYGISVGRAGGTAASAGMDKKAKTKRALKAVGIALLVLLVVGDILVLFVAMDLAMYEALKPSGLQGLLVLNATTTASLVVFVLGFVTALSTYYMSQAETALLALPVRPRHLLGAKLVMVYLSEFAMAFLLVGVAAAIYGIKEGPHPGFYVSAFLAALAAPLVPLALSYLVLVPLMSAIRVIRNKNAMMLIGGVVGAAFALLFNIYIQTASARLGDPAWTLAHVAGPGALVARIGSAYPPSYLAWMSMTSRGFRAAGYALAEFAMGLAATCGAVWLLGPAYAASLLGFDEQMLKRLKSTGEFVDRAFRRGGAMRALFLREWRLMNREPIYFLNGPAIVLLMPVIMVIMLFVQREALGALLAQLGDFRSGPGPLLVAAAFGGFLGSSTSIACTALSRDAKALPYIKALPVDHWAYMAAKFLHALAYSALGAAIGGVGVGIVAGLGALECAGAFAVALAFSAFVDIAGLWLDAANPRLSWDNPTAALKQNPNAVIVILGTMGIIGALGLLSTRIALGEAGFVALYGGVFGVATAAALTAFPRYARRRIGELEA
jgi:ABC-2 type transport system permease protein